MFSPITTASFSLPSVDRLLKIIPGNVSFSEDGPDISGVISGKAVKETGVEVAVRLAYLGRVEGWNLDAEEGSKALLQAAMRTAAGIQSAIKSAAGDEEKLAATIPNRIIAALAGAGFLVGSPAESDEAMALAALAVVKTVLANEPMKVDALPAWAEVHPAESETAAPVAKGAKSKGKSKPTTAPVATVDSVFVDGKIDPTTMPAPLNHKMDMEFSTADGQTVNVYRTDVLSSQVRNSVAEIMKLAAPDVYAKYREAKDASDGSLASRRAAYQILFEAFLSHTYRVAGL